MTDFIIKYWVQVIFSGILAIITWSATSNINSLKAYFKNTDNNIKDIADDIKELKVGQEASKKTNRAILKDKLQAKIRYHIINGSCSLHDRDILAELHREFKCNLGNGDMDDLVQKVFCLPIEEGILKGFKNE